MAAEITEPFTYSNGRLETVSSAVWDDNTASMVIATNQIAFSAASADGYAVHATAMSNVDHYVQAVVTPGNAEYTGCGLMVRGGTNPASMNGYRCELAYYSGAHHVEINRIDAGSSTSVAAASLGTSDDNPHTLRAEVTGNTIEIFVDGLSKLIYTGATSHTTNLRVGLYTGHFGGDTAFIDTFEAGTAARTFVYTGASQDFVVPTGVTTLTVDLFGAEGGGDYAGVTLTGDGGRVKCDVTVTAGETLRLFIGQQGATPGSITADVAASFNGGGAGWNGGGAGGGATDIRRTPYALADRLAIAPGGAGAGCNNGQVTTGGGGNGATPTGATGQNGISGPLAGVGATSSAGGAGGTAAGGTAGSSGALGVGGDGSVAIRGGGGGGGGYYGGGGGGGAGVGTAGAGGGAGSGLSTGVNETLQTGVRTGNGQTILTWTAGSGITGTATPTLDSFVAAGTGTYTPAAITGTVAVTLASFTAAGAGTYTPAAITGTTAVTLDAFVAAGSGTVTGAGITGTVAVTLDAFASTASGTHTPPPVTGTAAVTLAAFVSSASGTVAGPGEVSGGVNVTLAVFVAAAAGTVTAPTITGTAAVTLAPFGAIGTGTYTPAAITGTVAVILGLFVAVANDIPLVILTGPLTTILERHARTTSLERHPRTTEAT